MMDSDARNDMADKQTAHGLRSSMPNDSADDSSLNGLTKAVGIDPVDTDRDLLIGCTLGGVTIVRLIAEGGMGRVYEGRQQKPNRSVAVKVIRPGLTSPSLLKRFEYEAEVLGRLQHPGIAHIYSVGVHHVGQASVPYFVMEYIHDAQPLTKYADALKLPTRQRLDLFRNVCDAVAHGHQKGVIHRDLKPGNILVDGTGQPKVIDFGIARATDTDVAVTTMQTDIGQLIGTLQYMSPEQFNANPNDIDVRSDVYALGVILYEMLAGRPPYDVNKKAIHEVARIVKEEDPAPLSTFNRAIKGDVAVIAGKCLEKERSLRYSSASELGADIARHLAGDLITASPPGFVDGLRRLARKHRAAALATCSAITVLILSVLGISYFYLRAEEQRNIAVANETAAKTERDRARRILAFLQEAFSAPDPTRIGREITVADVLTRLAQSTADGFADDAATEAEVLTTIGMTLESLGLFRDAEKPTSRAVALTESPSFDADQDAVRLRQTAMSTLARIRLFQERLPEAVDLYRGVLRIADSRMPDDPLFRVRNLNGLAIAYVRHGRFDDSLQALDQADRLIHDHGLEDSLEAIESQQYRSIAMGPVRISEPHFHESQRLAEVALEKSRRLLGPEHRKTAELLNDVAITYRYAGRNEEAERLLLEALGIDEKLLGREHWDTAKVLGNLGVLYRNTGRLDEAEKATERSLEILERQFGPDYSGAVSSLNTFANIKASRGKCGEAVPLYRKAIALVQRANPCDPRVSHIQKGLFSCLMVQHDDAAIARELAEGWTLAAKYCGAEAPAAALFLDRLYYGAIVTRKPEYAVPTFREVLSRASDDSDLTQEQIAGRQAQLAQLLCLVPRPAEAEMLARQAVVILQSSKGRDAETLDALSAQVEALLMLGRSDDAAGVLESLVSASTKLPTEGACRIVRAHWLQAVHADLMKGPLEAEPFYKRTYTPPIVQKRPSDGALVIDLGMHRCTILYCEDCAPTNLLALYKHLMRSRADTVRNATGADLVQSARSMVESRHYLQAKAVLQQAVSMDDAEETGATKALAALLQILNPPVGLPPAAPHSQAY